MPNCPTWLEDAFGPAHLGILHLGRVQGGGVSVIRILFLRLSGPSITCRVFEFRALGLELMMTGQCYSVRFVNLHAEHGGGGGGLKFTRNRLPFYQNPQALNFRAFRLYGV